MRIDPACPYCQRPLAKEEILAEVCSLSYSILSVYKNQYYRGRCVLSLKEHYEEIHEIDDTTYHGFMYEIKRISSLISNLYKPDKIQLAFYGDTVRHVHAHIVPKYSTLPDWGSPFLLNPESGNEETWKEVVETLYKELNEETIPV